MYPYTYICIQYGEMKKQSAGRRVRREKIRRKKMQVREKVGKSRNTVFFRGFVSWQKTMDMFMVNRFKTPQRRTALGSWDVEKVHGVVARRHLEVKCVKNQLRFWKSAGWFSQMGHSQLSPDFNIPTSLHWKATGQLQEQYGKPNLKNSNMILMQVVMSKNNVEHIQCLPFSQASHLEMQRFSIPRSGRKISCWPPRKSHAYRLRNTTFVSFVQLQLQLHNYTTPSHSWDVVHYTPLH